MSKTGEAWAVITDDAEWENFPNFDNFTIYESDAEKILFDLRMMYPNVSWRVVKVRIEIVDDE